MPSNTWIFAAINACACHGVSGCQEFQRKLGRNCS
jgi:hypothetical protein